MSLFQRRGLTTCIHISQIFSPKNLTQCNLKVASYNDLIVHTNQNNTLTHSSSLRLQLVTRRADAFVVVVIGPLTRDRLKVIRWQLNSTFGHGVVHLLLR